MTHAPPDSGSERPIAPSRPVTLSFHSMGGVVIALVLWGFLALLVWTAIYHAVKLGVRDALRERDAERKRASGGGGRSD